MNDFREVLDDYALDLGYRDPKFTWRNRREGNSSISERLDRFLANSHLCQLFSRAVVTHGVEDYLDHLPIWLESNGGQRRGKKLFKFETIWIREEDYEKIIKESW